MPGTATLDPNILVDDLSTTADELRQDLHADFGVRAYRVFTVSRTWSGELRGEGQQTEVVTEILPAPLVEPWNGRRYVMEPCGLDDVGTVRLREVSLSYTQAELDGGGSLGDNVEFLIRIDEGHGQAQRSAYFTHEKPPYVDRIEDIGWKLWLKKTEG